MTLFWIFCAAMLLLAMLFVVWPLWKKSAGGNEVLRDAANLGILRDQSSELETDLKNGLFTQEAYEQGKRELQGRLLDEVKVSEQPTIKLPRNPAKTLAMVMLVLLPLFTVAMYYQVGTPKALRPGATTNAVDNNSLITTEEGFKELEDELDSNPENAQGWYRLASSYVAMKRYSEAAKAYEQLVKQVPDDAQLWANYADVYAMANGKSLQNEQVKKFINQALDIDPDNITALALGGSSAMQGKDYVMAVTHWQKVVGLLQPGSADAQQFESGLQQARDLLAAEPGGKEKLAKLATADTTANQQSASGVEAITGTVTLSPQLAAYATPEDIVFVLARAAQGPKMPLAVLKKQVKDFPLQFSLDDSMAMQPQLKLSGFDQVVVVARVSKSGSPMAQSGDLEGLTKPVTPGVKELNIVIDSVVP
ncbi:MAG: c-type cytochrome biogenesis protein CcmI [Gallionella sp.]